MARLSKEDWLQEGFKLLSEFAQNKLRITYLCERLQVTRGSFYHHFKSIDDYVEALMQAWEKVNTLEFIEAAEKGSDPSEYMQLLNAKVMQANQKVEAAIRSWSFYHPVVQAHQKRVDEIRLNFLTNVFLSMGMSATDALKNAKLDYAVLIGIQQLYPDISAADLQQLSKAYQPSWKK